MMLQNVYLASFGRFDQIMDKWENTLSFLSTIYVTTFQGIICNELVYSWSFQFFLTKFALLSFFHARL